jgi:cell division protein FtsI/penicillin-binding protein 2
MSNRSSRQIVIIFTLTITALFLILRLITFSVFQQSKWVSRRDSRLNRTISLEASRGRIFANDGQTVLARSEVRVSVVADTFRVMEQKRDVRIARLLSRILDSPYEEIQSRLHSRRSEVWLKRDISRDEFRRIFQLQSTGELKGISVIREISRSYPVQPLCSSLLGFAKGSLISGRETLGPFSDLRGIEGLEASYEDDLTGIDGEYGYQINRFDAIDMETFRVNQPLVPGNDLVLTVQLPLQSILRDVMRNTVTEHQASSCMGIVMDPKTGGILASVSVENTEEYFDDTYLSQKPVNCWAPESRRNLPTTAVFEPGSVWKPVIMAIALEKGFVTPSEVIEWEPAVAFGRKKYRDWKKFPPQLELADILVQSSNVGIIKVNKRIFSVLTHQQIADEIETLGFNSPVPMDFPVHPRGMLNPAGWKPISIGALAEGYELAVTMVQLGSFYCSIANGGYRVNPHFGSELRNPATGRIIRKLNHSSPVRVLSARTSDFIRDAMIGCVDHGTGVKADLSAYGCTVAGKTATAKLFEAGSYNSGKYRASFAGFFPADSPRYVVVISVENPSAGLYYGGSVAAPSFRAVGERILRDIHCLEPVEEPSQC